MRDGAGETRRRQSAVALAAWVAVSVAGPLAARGLDRVRIAGVPGGFWYAELGAVLLLVAVLAGYAAVAGRGGDDGEDGG
jgi:putative solute:sodium symporter small subunit